MKTYVSLLDESTKSAGTEATLTSRSLFAESCGCTAVAFNTFSFSLHEHIWHHSKHTCLTAT